MASVFSSISRLNCYATSDHTITLSYAGHMHSTSLLLVQAHVCAMTSFAYHRLEWVVFRRYWSDSEFAMR